MTIKRFGALTALLCAFTMVLPFNTAAGSETADLKRLVSDCLPSVVSIQIQGPLHIHKGKNGKIHPSKSRGSGFFIDAEGGLITNHHVIQNAKSIEVILHTGQRRPATIVGSDTESDVALLQVDLDGLEITPVRFGQTDRIEIGEQVFAIGNPLGLSHSVTRGIISALHRDGIKPRSEHKYSDFIQTDAAINKGSSGGPLFNMKGEVLGVNTAIKKKGRGLAFAIPADWVVDLLPRLRMGGIQRSWLGVAASPTKESIENPGQFVHLRVGKVISESPAEMSGIQKGDILQSLNGVPFEGMTDFRWRMAIAGIGKTVQMQVQTPGEEVRKVAVTLSERPPAKKKKKPIKLFSENDVEKFWGIVLKRDKKRLIVDKISEGSAAENAGLQPGDQITRVGSGENLNLKGVLRAAHQRKKSRVLELELIRNNRRYYVPLYAPVQ